MKKIYLIILMLCFTASNFINASVKNGTSIGLVNIQKVFLSVHEGQSIKKQLEEFYKGKQQLLKDDEKKLQEMQKKFEKQRAVLNSDALRKKENEMRDLYMGLQNKTMQYQKELQQLEASLKKPLEEKIKKLIDDISLKSNVDMTVEVGNPMVPSYLLYVKNKKDLTDDIINAYNKAYPEKKK